MRDLTLSVPLWALGAALLVVGPWAVRRFAQSMKKRVERGTNDALATLRTNGSSADESEEDATMEEREGRDASTSTRDTKK